VTVLRDFWPANCATYFVRLSDETSTGANKTYQQKGDRGRLLGESSEFKRLRRAVEKTHGDRDNAIAFVRRLYHCVFVRGATRCGSSRYARAARSPSGLTQTQAVLVKI
jgi:hypothetical protein